MFSIPNNRWTALMGLALTLASGASSALTTAYTASQGPKPNLLVAAPPPLSDAVAGKVAGFTGAVTELGRNEFENAASTTTFNYTGGTATIAGGNFSIINGDAQVDTDREKGRYNMTPGLVNPISGRPLFGHWLEATSNFTISFSSAVSAFSFYGTDFGDFDGTFSIEFMLGNTSVSSYALTSPGDNGNLLYFGLASSTNFDSVIFHITQAANATDIDVLGFDSFVVGRTNVTGTPIPEPASLALVGLALAGAGLATRKAQRALQR